MSSSFRSQQSSSSASRRLGFRETGNRTTDWERWNRRAIEIQPSKSTEPSGGRLERHAATRRDCLDALGFLQNLRARRLVVVVAGAPASGGQDAAVVKARRMMLILRSRQSGRSTARGALVQQRVPPAQHLIALGQKKRIRPSD